MSIKIERCQKYQRYILIHNRMDARCVEAEELPGYDEIAHAQGRGSDGLVEFDKAVSRTKQWAKNNHHTSNHRVTLWGVPYPANGGRNPNMKCLLCIDGDEVDPPSLRSVMDQKIDDIMSAGPIG